MINSGHQPATPCQCCHTTPTLRCHGHRTLKFSSTSNLMDVCRRSPDSHTNELSEYTSTWNSTQWQRTVQHRIHIQKDCWTPDTFRDCDYSFTCTFQTYHIRCTCHNTNGLKQNSHSKGLFNTGSTEKIVTPASRTCHQTPHTPLMDLFLRECVKCCGHTLIQLYFKQAMGCINGVALSFSHMKECSERDLTVQLYL